MQSSATAAIDAVDLAKTYGHGDKAVHALAGLSLEVPTGIIFGMLGPNGAGKSTTVKILTTLTRADAGHAVVAGADVAMQAAAVRRRIGYVSQRPSFNPMATGTENLVHVGRVRGISARSARSRAQELLDQFGLTDAAHRLAGKWSGGMQRKLDVAMALLHRPSVLFLDEPSTGLDPQSQLELWSQIRTLARDGGTTVLLTTHYLEEADALAGTLAIVDHGRVVVTGTPDALKGELAGDTVTVGLADPAELPTARDALRQFGSPTVDPDGATVAVQLADGAAVLPRVLAALSDSGVASRSATVGRPSLAEVYLRHAGRSFASADTASRPPGAPTRQDPTQRVAEVA